MMFGVCEDVLLQHFEQLRMLVPVQTLLIY